MIALPQRQTLLALISQACQAGAWLHPAAAAGDRRTPEQRTPHVSANKFTQAELRGWRMHVPRVAAEHGAPVPPQTNRE